MKLLLFAATELEIASSIEVIKKFSWPVEVVITGVGLMAATYSITQSIYRHRPDMMLQAGVAGSFSENIKLSTSVLIRSESVGDSGVWEKDKFQSLFDLSLVKASDDCYSDRKLVNNNEWMQQIHLPVVDAVTVNEITTKPQQIDYYQHYLGAQMESLEGAALHFVGLKERVAFLQLRSASNYVGERDKRKWQLAGAIASLNTELQKLIPRIIEP